MYNTFCTVVQLRQRNMERYRSGHNEAVLKTVCPKGRVGSNPTLSADLNLIEKSNSEKYPSWPKGHPWKGCRSLTAARGFKSLLLRFFCQKKKKKVVDKALCE